eukprot:4109744-Prymnesium_polylepis.1
MPRAAVPQNIGLEAVHSVDTSARPRHDTARYTKRRSHQAAWPPPDGSHKVAGGAVPCGVSEV